MRYYHIKLSPGAKNICSILLPWGKYEYEKLPMRVYNRHYIFQENISELFEGFYMVCAYVDKVLLITKHEIKYIIKTLDKFLQRLAEE